jgi:DNA polymerase-3 subunit alpha
MVEGKVQNDSFTGGLRVTAERLLTLGEARSRFARSLRLAMNGDSNAERLRGLLAPYRNGSCPVRISYRNGDAEAELTLPDAWRVRLDDALIASLNEWLSADNVKVIYT